VSCPPLMFERLLTREVEWGGRTIITKVMMAYLK
jgi:hypothetical protein